MRAFFLLIFLWLLGGAESFAQTAIWTAQSSALWSNSANWSPTAVPKAGQPVSISLPANGKTPVIPSGYTANCGALTINSNAALTITGTLNASGAVNNAGTLTITGTLNTSGTLSNAALLTVNGMYNANGALSNTNTGTVTIGAVGGTGSRTIMARNTLTNSGTLTINGTLKCVNNFAVRNDGTITSSDAGLLVFTNSSPITFSGSGTTSLSNVAFGPGALTFTTTNFVNVRREATLEDGNVTSNGKLQLTSDANSTGMIYNDGLGVVTGNIVAQRYIIPNTDAGLGYRHFSSPVANATFAMFENGTDFTAICNSAYSYPTNNALVPYPTIFYYDQSLVPATTTDPTPFNFGFLSPADKSNSLDVGRGYTVNIAPTNATTGAPNIISLTGIPTTGDVLSPAYGRGRNAIAGFNLVGNPYPGFININLVMNDNLDDSTHSGFDGVVYVYHATGHYSGAYKSFYVDSTSIDSLNRFFPMMRGFLVKKTDTIGTASYQFHNTQRVGQATIPGTGYPTSNTIPFYRVAQPHLPTVAGLYLNVANTQVPSLQDEARVEFRGGATTGHDARYDALRPGDNVGENPTLFVVSPIGEECMRNGLPVLRGTVTVPIGLRTLTPGQSYTLRPNKVLQLGAGQIYLEDRQTGKVQDLVTQPTFTFKAEANKYEHRFFLRFESVASTTHTLEPSFETYPNPVAAGQELQFSAHGLAEGNATATLLTTFGTVILTQSVQVSGNGLLLGTLNTNGIKPGIYILRFSSATNVTTQRIQVR